MADPVFNTAAGAFVLGLVTSAHCAVMCGPLVCAALPRPGPAYHGGRILAYTSLGAAAGAMGTVPLRLALETPAALLPWALALLLGLTAMGWKPRLPAPRSVHRFAVRTRLRGNTAARGFLLGALTPLLPCGPLYLVFAACLVSGSALTGAEFAFVFTLGTIPLLWLSHAGWRRAGLRISPARMAAAQRIMAAAAMLMTLWRLYPSAAAAPSAGDEPACPLCAAKDPS